VNTCKNYTVLREADRAQGNTKWPYNKHDNSLQNIWYRFRGAAGNQMPDKCVLGHRCGVPYPGWLNGEHPTVAQGVVTLKVCFNDAYGSCCGWEEDIQVKNCTSYYVYKLKSTNGWYFRYCGNGGAGKLH